MPIEAKVLTADQNLKDLAKWLGQDEITVTFYHTGEASIRTKSGKVPARTGDYIVKSAVGGFHIIDRQTFQERFLPETDWLDGVFPPYDR